MKKHIRTSLIALILAIPGFLPAQYFKFMDFSPYSGQSPNGSVILDSVSQTLYGMTYNGGANGNGTIFRFDLAGAGFIKLMDLTQDSGANPRGSLLKFRSTLFGMTSTGGANGYGTIFKIRTDGTNFKDLFDFNLSSTGGDPNGSLILSGDLLYGMTYDGGASGKGVIFSIDTNGSAYTVLHSFNGTDGANPWGDLALGGNMLYGMTKYGGAGANFGTVFKMEITGANFNRMFSFDWVHNGGYPYGSPTLINGFLYGMTSQGGNNGDGTIFKMNTSGIGFSKLFDFNAATTGRGPWGNLVYDGTSLFGMVDGNGSPNLGTIFSVGTDGNNYESIYNFTDPLNGSSPRGTPVVVPIPGGTIFYGMMMQGGGTNDGVLFKYNTLGTGISPVQEKISVSVFPVPASHILYVRSSDLIMEIRIIDMLGKLVYLDKPTQQEVKIPIDNLDKGIYFIQIQGLSQNFTRKFIKE